MRNSSMVVALAFVMLCAAAGTASAQSNIGSTRSDRLNEAEIRKLYEEFTAAWNAHDTQKMGGMWAIDGDHLEPDGRVAKGREEVATLITKQHQSVFKDTQLALTIADVWFLTDSVALVDGSYELTGARDPDGNALPSRKGHLTSILLKEQGQWWIAASRLMIPAPLPYREG